MTSSSRSYEIFVTESAEADIQRLSDVQKLRVGYALNSLELDPSPRHPAVTEDPLSPRDRPRFVMVMHDVMITFRLLNPNLAEVFAVAAVDPHFP